MLSVIKVIFVITNKVIFHRRFQFQIDECKYTSTFLHLSVVVWTIIIETASNLMQSKTFGRENKL